MKKSENSITYMSKLIIHFMKKFFLYKQSCLYNEKGQEEGFFVYGTQYETESYNQKVLEYQGKSLCLFIFKTLFSSRVHVFLYIVCIHV